MSQTQQPTLLVTGASGQLGRRVIELLLETTPASAIIATTRTPSKLDDFAAQGVTVRQADFDDADALPAAFAGAERMLLISTEDAVTPGRRMRQHLNAISAARAAGVKHVVYTGIVNPVPESPVAVNADHAGTEASLATSGMGWTIIRENIYMDILPGTLARAVQLGQHFSAAGDGKAAYVTREDCARAAAAALAADFTGTRVLNITGPEALSQADLTRLASELSGKPVAYVPLPLESIIQGMVSAGLPEQAAALYASFDAGIAQGYFEAVSTDFETLTGRQPTRAADFLAAHRDEIAGA
jgi:NAD(P)H dehydrogenase (quinone)